MKCLISGASGLVGSALVTRLEGAGHEVWSLTRSPAGKARAIGWQPADGAIDGAALEGFDAVVHLAGESIAGGRWSDAKKARIRGSRVAGTELLTRALAACEKPPATLISASAIGYYGDRGDEMLDEDSAPGEGFLAEVTQAWEAAADPAREAGIRVVHPRIGIVLARDGGALAKMLTPFRLGLGGPVGSGDQFMSWIALDDLVGAIVHALESEALAGPVNAVAPAPVRNRVFTKTLGEVLHRPTVLPLPAAMLRLGLGEMAEELLLASARVDAGRLEASGYRCRFPELEGALRHILS